MAKYVELSSPARHQNIVVANPTEFHITCSKDWEISAEMVIFNVENTNAVVFGDASISQRLHNLGLLKFNEIPTHSQLTVLVKWPKELLSTSERCA